ncbi:hypothetical protein, partial [Cupriavidus basilensis]|uniref:hypothetical protein n=1 Tax=Cupriavidus basilensis TaxID=68895 RepID=UPI0023E7A332
PKPAIIFRPKQVITLRRNRRSRAPKYAHVGGRLRIDRHMGDELRPDRRRRETAEIHTRFGAFSGQRRSNARPIDCHDTNAVQRLRHIESHQGCCHDFSITLQWCDE